MDPRQDVSERTGPGGYDREPLVGTLQANNLHPGIIEFSLSISYGQFVPAAWRAVGRWMPQGGLRWKECSSDQLLMPATGTGAESGGTCAIHLLSLEFDAVLRDEWLRQQS